MKKIEEIKSFCCAECGKEHLEPYLAFKEGKWYCQHCIVIRTFNSIK